MRPGTSYVIEAASTLSPPDWHEIKVQGWDPDCGNGDCGGGAYRS